MTDKEKYRDYCRHHAVALYLHDWWLDAVCDDNWDVVFDERNKSAFAFPVKKKYGLRLIAQPKLTLGLAPAGTNDVSEFLPKLPAYDMLDLYLLPGVKISDQKDFKIKSRQTYRLNDINDTEKTFKKFSSSTRQQIRKAQKSVTVSETEDVELLYKMISLTFKRQQKKVPYSLTFVNKINEACARRNCRKMLVAKDSSGNIHGACFVAWDRETAYYVMGGSDPKYRSSAAYSLLMWSAIQEAAKHVKQFDFCGSMQASIAKFFQGFGGEQTAYLQLKKVNSKALKLLLAVTKK